MHERYKMRLGRREVVISLLFLIIVTSNFSFIKTFQIQVDDDIDDDMDIEIIDSGQGRTIRDDNSKDKLKIREMKKSVSKLNISLDKLPQYKIEFSIILLCILSLVIYCIGLNVNTAIAKEWVLKNRNLIQEYFDYCGDTNLKSTKFMQINENKYILWCTGSEICKGFLCELNLLPRQSVLSLITNFLSNKHFKDSLKLTTYINDDVEIPILIMGNKQILFKNEDIVNHMKLCKDRSNDIILENQNYSDNFHVASELNEFYASIAKHSFGKMINMYYSYIGSILFTDLMYDSMEKEFSFLLHDDTKNSLKSKKIVIELQFPSGIFKPQNVDLSNFFNQYFEFVKQLSQNKFLLSKEGKSKLSKFRETINARVKRKEHILRVEKAMQRKDQKVREEKEKIMNTTNPSIQMKLEAKREKREQKNARKKLSKSIKIMA